MPPAGYQGVWSFTAQYAAKPAVHGSQQLLPRLSTTLPTVVGGNLWVSPRVLQYTLIGVAKTLF